MVYTINQKIKTLDEVGEKYFLNQLKILGELNHVADQKNKNWFEVLPYSYKKYPQWFFLFDDDKPVAFSTIQEFNPGEFRVLTRTYIYLDYRRATQLKMDTFNSPTMRILPEQLKYINGYKTAFVSMQSGRSNALKRFGRKLEYRTNLQWTLCENMHQTCNNCNDPECWQNIIYNGTSPNLKQMTRERYTELWNRPA
jgi:hypothetical protein